MTTKWPTGSNYKGPLVATHIPIPEILKKWRKFASLQVAFPFPLGFFYVSRLRWPYNLEDVWDKAGLYGTLIPLGLWWQLPVLVAKGHKYTVFLARPVPRGPRSLGSHLTSGRSPEVCLWLWSLSLWPSMHPGELSLQPYHQRPFGSFLCLDQPCHHFLLHGGHI